jgi:hypothetical protein
MTPQQLQQQQLLALLYHQQQQQQQPQQRPPQAFGPGYATLFFQKNILKSYTFCFFENNCQVQPGGFSDARGSERRRQRPVGVTAFGVAAVCTTGHG